MHKLMLVWVGAFKDLSKIFFKMSTERQDTTFLIQSLTNTLTSDKLFDPHGGLIQSANPTQPILGWHTCMWLYYKLSLSLSPLSLSLTLTLTLTLTHTHRERDRVHSRSHYKCVYSYRNGIVPWKWKYTAERDRAALEGMKFVCVCVCVSVREFVIQSHTLSHLCRIESVVVKSHYKGTSKEEQNAAAILL